MPSLLDRLKKSVSKTRSEIAARVEGLFGGDRRLDPEQLQRLENALLAADLGVRTTRELLDAVRDTRRPTPRCETPTSCAARSNSNCWTVLRAVPAVAQWRGRRVRALTSSLSSA